MLQKSNFQYLFSRYVIIVTALFFAVASVAYGHNSIIPADGWKVGPPMELKYKEHSKLIKAQSEHFVILTTFPSEAAEQMVKHLEAWHSQIYKVLPNCAEIEKAKKSKWCLKPGKKLSYLVFAYPQEQEAYYNKTKASTTTAGMYGRPNPDKPGFRTVKVTALQHEVFHFWDGFFYDKGISGSMSEGGANFFGFWDIDKAFDENLNAKMSDTAWRVAYDTRFGKANQRSKYHWMTAEEFFTDQRPPGCQVYHQGMLFYRYLLANEKGRWYASIIFPAYQKNSVAQQWMKTSADNKYIKEQYRDVNVPFKKLTSTAWETRFTDEFLKMFDKDWCEYLEKEYEKLYGKLPENILKFKKLDLFLKGANVQTMSRDSKAFSNRNYKWISVPRFLEGMNYTQTAGGTFAQIQLTAKENMTVYIAGDLKENSNGWLPITGGLRYNDNGQSTLKLYKINVKALQTLVIPQKGWAGTILFFKD